jgi:hypothetical protein
VSTDVAREHLATALAETVGRIDALAAHPVAPASLRRAQLDVFRDLGGPASSARLAAEATRMLMLGQPLEALDGAARAAAGVSLQALRAAATQCRRSLNVALIADPASLEAGRLPGFVVEEAR